MKKYCFCCVLLMSLLFFTVTGFAQDCGLTNGKGIFKMDARYEWMDFDMELVSNTATATWNSDYEVPYERNAIILGASYGVCDYMDIQLSLGILEDELVAESRDGLQANHTQKGDSNYLCKVGLKFNFIQFDSGAYIGGAASYGQWESGDASYYNISATDPRSFKTECQEYTGSVYVGMKRGAFSPWIGVGYTQIEIDQKLDNYPGFSGSITHEYEIEDNLGVVAGLSYTVNDHFDISARGAFINKNVINVGLGYKF